MKNILIIFYKVYIDMFDDFSFFIDFYILLIEKMRKHVIMSNCGGKLNVINFMKTVR